MIISESWLREWVSPSISTQQLADLLTQAGLEVETIKTHQPLGDKVLVGQIKSVVKHPDADKLNVCQVDVGQQDLLTIVCGAPNACKGLVAPVALVGAVLPGNFKISRREVRGIASSGMICAASELGLTEHAGNLMVLQSDAPIGKTLDNYLALQDAQIEVDLTPDRGDCLSIAGVARDVAALSQAPFTPIDYKTIEQNIPDYKLVDLLAPKACPRYVGRIIKGVNVNAQTPDYLKEKLRRMGVRSISPVVDVTNYVMLELGQPMHAFDLAKIDGDVCVRMAHHAEALTLLDGQNLTMDEQTLVIADQSKAIALAGIMGGKNSQIDDTTADIMLESAYFTPLSIAQKARELGLHTDASHRYERGVDSKLQAVAIERASELLLDIVGGACGPVFDVCDKVHMPTIEKIIFRPQRARDLLGMKVSDEKIEQHFVALQMQVELNQMSWMVTRPSWRSDITAEHDLIEEVGRLEGLNKIIARAPVLRGKAQGSDEGNIDRFLLKSDLAGQGFQEIVTYSFIDQQDQRAISGLVENELEVSLRNPIASNMSHMRLSCLPGLLNTACINEQRHHSSIRLFEVGNIFQTDLKSETHVKETEQLALLMGGKHEFELWEEVSRDVDYFDLKGEICRMFDRAGVLSRVTFAARSDFSALHPGQAAAILFDDVQIGYLGVLHPQAQKHFDLQQSYIVAQLNLQYLREKAEFEYIRPSKYPISTRDIALVVKENVSAGDILEKIRESCSKLLKNCVLFDTYKGSGIDEGSKSLAIKLTFQSPVSSLSNDEVDALIAKTLDCLHKKHGATLRS